MQIRELALTELLDAYELVKMLYTTLSYKEFEDFIYQMQKESYKMVALFDKDKLLVFIGLKIQTNLKHKKHLYIYEFIAKRSSLNSLDEVKNYLEQYSNTNLCTSIQNKEDIFIIE
jgi:hypothetical protein